MPQNIKEYDDVYFKILSVINSCDTIPQLEICGDSLVEVFSKKKFKRDPITKREQQRMTYQLIDMVAKKKNSIRFRKHHDKKNKLQQ